MTPLSPQKNQSVQALKLLWTLNRKLFLFSLILPSLLIVLIIVILWMKFFPYRPLEIRSSTILSTKVKAGDNLIYQVSYCKYDSIPIKVSRTLTGMHNLSDGSQNFIAFPSVQTVTKVGCATVTIQLPIPQGAIPDVYTMTVDAESSPNPLRKINVTFVTGKFEVYH